jgi:hypothetical protein
MEIFDKAQFNRWFHGWILDTVKSKNSVYFCTKELMGKSDKESDPQELRGRDPSKSCYTTWPSYNTFAAFAK